MSFSWCSLVKIKRMRSIYDTVNRWWLYMWPWMRKSVICQIRILSNAYIQMLIIEWFCIVGQYNFVDEKSNYCSTFISSLVSWLCKIAEKRAFEYKQLTKILFYKWLIFASTVTYVLYYINCIPKDKYNYNHIINKWSNGSFI